MTDNMSVYWVSVDRFFFYYYGLDNHMILFVDFI